MEENPFFNASDYEIQYDGNDKKESDTIYIVKKVDNNEKYIAKSINIKNNFDGDEQMSFLYESLILHKLRHPAIANLIGINFKSLVNPSLFKPTFITEYFSNESIEDIINKNSHSLQMEKLTFTKKYINLLGISDAIQYLHNQGITHLNLKPKNILLDSNYYPRISNFYFSRFITEKMNLTKEGEKDAFIYSAPEVLFNKDNDEQSEDVYSFAMIAYEIITEKIPFSEDDSIDLRNKILKGYRPTFSESVPLNLQSLLSRCWSENPKERPSFKEIFDILLCEIHLNEESIDKEEIMKYLSILNGYHAKYSNNKNEINFVKEINDLKATFYNCFGDFYQNYNSIQKNSKRIEYFEKAAKFGNSEALNNLGTFYYNGDGVEQNFNKAKKYYEQSAKLGNFDALNNLGLMYFNGEGVEQDISKSIEYFERSANLGNSEALNYLGNMYFNGEGVEQDISKSMKYYEKSAKLGNSEALNRLGTFYYNGDGVEQNFIKAKEYYEQSSKLSNSDALNYLGSMHYNGEGVEQNFITAKEFFEQSAKLGNSEALNNLGILYYYGDGVEQNFIKAKDFFEQSAKLGNSYALSYLGYIYYNGEGVKQDVSKSKEYFEQSAKLGNTEALNNLNYINANSRAHLNEIFAFLFILILIAFIFYLIRYDLLIIFQILLHEIDRLTVKFKAAFINK